MPPFPAHTGPTTDMDYDSLRALELLKRGTGRPDTRFRERQEEAIRHLVEGRVRQLLVQKTGWGKSFVYFITTRLLREAGLGPTLLVSPLLALMHNQIAAAGRMGVRAGGRGAGRQRRVREGGNMGRSGRATRPAPIRFGLRPRHRRDGEGPRRAVGARSAPMAKS